jgi:phosphatidylglycerophosphate synthase
VSGGLTSAALWAPHPALLAERVGGLTVLERHLHLLRRAGFSRVWVGAPRPAGPLRLPDGLDVSWASLGEARAGVEPPYLGVSGDHLVRLSALKDAAAQTPDVPVSWRDAQGRGVLHVVCGVSDVVRFETRALSEDASVALTSPVRGTPAEAWLLREAMKSTDGFMARHFDRRISLAVTRRLLDTRVTPNQMTVASTAVGLAGAALLAAGTYPLGVGGALLVWLHSTLDGCDGELARLRFQESPLGGVLDFWGDNLVHAALFLCLGAGVARAEGSLRPAALGVVAAVSAGASAALAYSHSKAKAAARAAAAPAGGAAGPFFSGVADPGPGAAAGERRLAAFEDTLAQRDFVYLLVALAAAGRLPWFLWASAVGSPLFLAVLLWLRRARSA